MKGVTYKSFFLESGRKIIVLLSSIILFYGFNQISEYIAVLNENLERQDYLNLLTLYCSLLFGSIFFLHKNYNLFVQIVITTFVLIAGYLLAILLFQRIDCNGSLILYSYSWIYIASLLTSLFIVLTLIRARRFMINSIIALTAFFIIIYYPFFFN